MANEPMFCKCGRPLSERYARELGMCVECKLKHIRRFDKKALWTDKHTRERVRNPNKKLGRPRKVQDDE